MPPSHSTDEPLPPRPHGPPVTICMHSVTSLFLSVRRVTDYHCHFSLELRLAWRAGIRVIESKPSALSRTLSRAKKKSP